jgi:hypothetical protein
VAEPPGRNMTRMHQCRGWVSGWHPPQSEHNADCGSPLLRAPGPSIRAVLPPVGTPRPADANHKVRTTDRGMTRRCGPACSGELPAARGGRVGP